MNHNSDDSLYHMRPIQGIGDVLTFAETSSISNNPSAGTGCSGIP